MVADGYIYITTQSPGWRLVPLLNFYNFITGIEIFRNFYVNTIAGIAANTMATIVLIMVSNLVSGACLLWGII